MNKSIKIENYKHIEKEINDNMKRYKTTEAMPVGPIVSLQGLTGVSCFIPHIKFINFNRIEIEYASDYDTFYLNFFIDDLQIGHFSFDLSFRGMHRDLFFYFGDGECDNEKYQMILYVE